MLDNFVFAHNKFIYSDSSILRHMLARQACCEKIKQNSKNSMLQNFTKSFVAAIKNVRIDMFLSKWTFCYIFAQMQDPTTKASQNH